MIHVLFVPGMFGSTLEFVLRSYSREYEPIKATIMPDGSMHSFNKQVHLFNGNIDLAFSKIKPNTITTIIYPFRQQHLSEILVELNQFTQVTDSFILVYAADLAAAELNMLFQYHKIANGAERKAGLEIFCGNNVHDIKNWNTAYTHWSQMQPWQLREWLSLFYVSWVMEWQQSQHQVTDKFFKIPNTQILDDPYREFSKIIEYCGLTLQPGLEDFATAWKQSQQYVLTEYILLDQIVNHAINNDQIFWSPTNIIAEAIVQRRLRSLGYEIQCDGLNVFPTDANTLYTLLDKV